MISVFSFHNKFKDFNVEGRAENPSSSIYRLLSIIASNPKYSSKFYTYLDNFFKISDKF